MNTITREQFRKEAGKMRDKYSQYGISVLITDFDGIARCELAWNPKLYKKSIYKQALKEAGNWKYNGYTIVD